MRSDPWESICFQWNHSQYSSSGARGRWKGSLSALVHVIHPKFSSSSPSAAVASLLPFSYNRSISIRHITPLSSRAMSLVKYLMEHSHHLPSKAKKDKSWTLPRCRAAKLFPKVQGKQNGFPHEPLELSDSSKGHLFSSHNWMEMSQVDHCIFLVCCSKC